MGTIKTVATSLLLAAIVAHTTATPAAAQPTGCQIGVGRLNQAVVTNCGPEDWQGDPFAWVQAIGVCTGKVFGVSYGYGLEGPKVAPGETSETPPCVGHITAGYAWEKSRPSNPSTIV